MELREFFAIFVQHKKLFLGIVCGSIVCGCMYYFVQPQTYHTSLTLNITRDGVQDVDAYMYDDFYRLQADERFADTVVQWIDSPYVRITVFAQGKDRAFTAKRLSSQVVNVEYITDTVKEGNDVAIKLISVLNEETQKLNQKQARDSWFMILGSNPVVQDHTYALFFLFCLFSAIGFFLAFWAVMIAQYVGETEIDK